MRLTLLFILLISTKFCLSQDHHTLLAEQALYEEQLLEKYHSLKGSLDDHARLEAMHTLSFYRFDSLFRVVARLDTAEMSSYFQLQTTQHRPVWYRIYSYLSFTLAGKNFRMPVYQSKSSVAKGESKLFFPFTDLTNGHDTYDGGRYIEMPMPKGNTVVLDFNKCFNPYCVYSHVYSCELVPKENHLDIEVKAGIKTK